MSDTPSTILKHISEQALSTMHDRELLSSETPCLLMVSGGSDSAALAYIMADLREQGKIGPLALLHVNHQLRGEDAAQDAQFVAQIAQLLDIPLFMCEIDVRGEAKRSGENLEAVARRERYLAAHEALASMCMHEAYPLSSGRIVTAHTADDRIENFYMRSIVGTGPGGFRSMLYQNGPVVRPLLDLSRDQLRTYLQARVALDMPCMRDEHGELWREDATNAHTDRFRAYVRHEIVPRAKERNPQLTETLVRSMNLIADEDDMLESFVDELFERYVDWLDDQDPTAGCILAPDLGAQPLPLLRRLIVRVLQMMLGADARVESVSVDGVLDAWVDAQINSGYVTNIQGNIAVSANKQGVRIEPMAAFRARRKRV
ncbi:tRNA lysidine(34) synthetase TilS [Adlercreutzia agrestimuris]|uniref:tRNA lysidine(34) synthetase TilS n=1 Tax=Adlercreutzia agrestimuris TaxID=2941324 RepID=UPI00203B4B42|nr:tRNA lysidine(34) synthetase TilS [Adlercreutzia agrestimuris]